MLAGGGIVVGFVVTNLIVIFLICNRNNYKRKIEKSLRKTDMEVMCPVLERQESIVFCSIDKGEKNRLLQ